MLYSIDKGQYIDFTPYENDFRIWKGRLAAKDYDKISIELNARIDGDEIHTSSWIPGSDWTGTAFEPIYSLACHKDEQASGKFFGLILWEVVKNRSDVWSYGRYENNGIPIKGLTYFKLRNPPPKPQH